MLDCLLHHLDALYLHAVITNTEVTRHHKKNLLVPSNASTRRAYSLNVAMNEPRELRRMPRGERCPECGSQRWYLQDGRRYCARGHQLEVCKREANSPCVAAHNSLFLYRASFSLTLAMRKMLGKWVEFPGRKRP